MDPTTVGSHLGGVLAIAIFVTLLKPLYERLVPPGNSLHDTGIRIMAIALGLAGSVIDFLGNHAYSFNGLETAASSGVLAGVASVLTYHLVAGAFFPADTVATVATDAPITVLPRYGNIQYTSEPSTTATAPSLPTA